MTFQWTLGRSVLIKLLFVKKCLQYFFILLFLQLLLIPLHISMEDWYVLLLRIRVHNLIRLSRWIRCKPLFLLLLFTPHSFTLFLIRPITSEHWLPNSNPSLLLLIDLTQLTFFALCCLDVLCKFLLCLSTLTSTTYCSTVSSSWLQLWFQNLRGWLHVEWSLIEIQ
jgi:hypothetical protein